MISSDDLGWYLIILLYYIVYYIVPILVAIACGVLVFYLGKGYRLTITRRKDDGS